MNANVNWFRREQEFRFNHHHRDYNNRPFFMDYQRNSVFGSREYGNYGYQPYEAPHNNFFGKLLGFGAVAALGYGIGKSGGFRPFFEKVGGFLNKLFGKKENHHEIDAAKKAEEQAKFRKEHPYIAAPDKNQPPQPGTDAVKNIQTDLNKVLNPPTPTTATATATATPTPTPTPTPTTTPENTNTLIQTKDGMQLPEVVIEGKYLNKPKSIPFTGIPTQQPKLDMSKLAARTDTKNVNPNDKTVKVQDAINYVSEADNKQLTAEQLQKMTPEQQEEYKKKIQTAIMN